MPSRVSLQQNEYYAHPRNSFWWLLGQLIGFDHKLPYARRVALTTAAGFAVWDVLLDCERKGSLDSNIQRDTEQCNDFSSLLQSHHSLRLIAFNGAASRAIFMRHCSPLLNHFPNLRTVLLPSSSPAYASISRCEKLQLWRQKLPKIRELSWLNTQLELDARPAQSKVSTVVSHDE